MRFNAMNYDILIRNGHVIDTTVGLNARKDIAILGNRIVDIENGTINAQHYVNAEGCYVFPGLIDYHTHIYYGGSEFAVNPDLLLPFGVTSTVDAGTCGYANFEVFYRNIVINSLLKIKSYLSVNPGGLFDPKYHVNYYSEFFNAPRIKRLKDKYRDQILGLKIMMSKVNVGEYGLDLLEATIALAEEIGDMNVVVHTTNPPCKAEEIADRLRPGDVFCHCFSGTGSTILEENEKISDKIIKAKNRGVIFDASNGISHYSHEVAEAAISQGFNPDIISTDIVSYALNTSNRTRSLPHLMSKYLGLGLDLNTIIKSVTETPARIMKMNGTIGTLKTGAVADVTIMKIIDKKVLFEDINNTYREYNKLFVPQMTICDGVVVYSYPEFNI